MKHKIYKIAKDTCYAEQKIAYNMALRANGRWGTEFRKLSTEIGKSDAVFRIRDAMMREWKQGYSYKQGRYDEDEVFRCMNKGLRNYLERPFVATDYTEIGKVF